MNAQQQSFASGNPSILANDKITEFSSGAGTSSSGPSQHDHWRDLKNRILDDWMRLIEVDEADLKLKLELLVSGLQRGYGLSLQDARAMVIERWDASLQGGAHALSA